MRRGTTPTHIFSIPVEPLLVEKVRVIYKQGSDTVLEKEAKGSDLVDGKLLVKLTQEETLGFATGAKVEIQVRVLTTGGDAMASGIMSFWPGRLLEEEVLS